jgi:hypothetical protein
VTDTFCGGEIVKKLMKYMVSLLLIIPLFSLTACSLFNSGTSSKEDITEYKEELDSSTGKWYLLDDNKKVTNTYFEFNGTKDAMSFNYVEDGNIKHSGSYRCVYKSNDGNNTYTLSFILKRTGEVKEDWVYTYVDDFESDFTQFTTIKEERSEGMNDGRIYAHIYRISELPYKLGTYVLEGKEYKQEKNNYKYASYYQVPAGTYALNENVSITFVMPKPYSYALFKYENGDEIVEGVYWTAKDKKTIYLFIEHDPYQYIKREDRENYDMTFSHDYPPDFYLRGNFEIIDSSISITSLYHHEYSPTKIEDKVFKFGIYKKQ